MKTLELINIADIAIEKENLETQKDRLEKKTAELEEIEEQLLKEQRRRDAKRKRKLANTSPVPGDRADKE